MMSRFSMYCFLAVFLVLAACRAAPSGAQADALTTIVLVRHAEKQQTGDDPRLTAEGEERALALAHVLGEADIDAVYATQYARTQDTAEPLARRLGVDVTVVSAESSYPADMAELISTKHRGQSVVIVSHSNTVPAIIRELGAEPIPSIEDDEYDDLYVVTTTASGQVDLLALRYGVETN